MHRRLKEVNTALASTDISVYWALWIKQDLNASKRVNDTVLGDFCWERIDLTIKVMDRINFFVAVSKY